MSEFDPVEVLHLAFPDLPEVALIPLASLTRQEHMPAGELICREGQFEDTFYVICSGEVEFTKQFTVDEERRLRTGGVGVYFGEMALLQEEARSANVRALSDVSLLVIDKAAFHGAIETNPVMMLHIVRTLIERMRANDAAALAEIRQQKEEIEAAYEALRQQEQARSEFLTTLAHELRTPLTSASGYMQLVQSGAMNGPALTLGLAKVSSNLDRVVSLVNDLLFVQEQDLIQPVLRPVSLPALLAVVAEELQDYAESHGAALVLDVPPDLPTIQADPDGLARAFNKLLDNAIKFSPDGGDIVVQARAQGGGVDIAIIDEGIGIPEAFMARLFERYAHTERVGDHVFGGVGLGLPIARHIIESHGGAISVHSIEGVGSTFTVHLPLNAGRESQGTEHQG